MQRGPSGHYEALVADAVEISGRGNLGDGEQGHHSGNHPKSGGIGME
jgi:hypothetical protein